MFWSKKPSAHRYLCALSFAESSFFPIPPDVMLIPISLARQDKIWFLASITTISSVLGGILGYLIGYFIFDSVEPWLKESVYWNSYENSKIWFSRWGMWAILLAGFSPIPYKIFTIAAGMTGINLFGFVLFSVIGRGARFFLIASLIYFGGENIKNMIEKYINRIGWSIIFIIFMIFLYFWKFS